MDKDALEAQKNSEKEEQPTVVSPPAKESAKEEPAKEKAEEIVSPLKDCEKYLGRRVECQNFYGSVVFSGPLAHEGRPAGSDMQLWLGIEWDDEKRGRHNGTVNGYEYFKTKQDLNSGTLVKFEKVNLGINILDGILAKYFKQDIPHDLKSTLLEQINNKETIGSSNASTLPDQERQKKEAAEKLAAVGEEAKKKLIQVEVDEDAYFETINRKEKKMVQFYGFDKIWERLSNLSQLNELSLQEVCISDIGQQHYLRKLLPIIETLSLEKNLLYDWQQIFQIGYELPSLQSLSISSNYLRPLKASVSEIASEELLVLHDNSRISGATVLNVFPTLKSLVLIDCKLNWLQVSRVIPAFPALEELFLCRNNMTDFENISITVEHLQGLKLLNLENTELENIDGLKPFLKTIPNLKKLILNKNKLTELGEMVSLNTITHISLEGNLINDTKIFAQLSNLENLTYLNIKHNPISDRLTKSYVRQRAIAELPKLDMINGSSLKKYERKDCEIFYFRKTFDEYFALTGQVYYKYNLEQFLEWAKINHPCHSRLMAVYGNPYEQLPEDGNINITENVGPKNVMVSLTLVVAAGPSLGKPEKVKKFPDNTTILSLKSVLSKLYGIPNDKLVLKYRINSHDPNEILDEDHKTLGFYGVKDGSQIIIDSN